jgi:hypothetical protein
VGKQDDDDDVESNIKGCKHVCIEEGKMVEKNGEEHHGSYMHVVVAGFDFGFVYVEIDEKCVNWKFCIGKGGKEGRGTRGELFEEEKLFWFKNSEADRGIGTWVGVRLDSIPVTWGPLLMKAILSKIYVHYPSSI